MLSKNSNFPRNSFPQTEQEGGEQQLTMNSQSEASTVTIQNEGAPSLEHPGVVWCLRALAGHCRRFRGSIALVLALVLIESCFIGAMPLSVKYFMDESAGGKAHSALVLVGWVLGIGVVLASGAGIIRNHIYAKVVAGTVSHLRERMFRQLQGLSISYFNRTSPGETMTRFSTDIAALENSLTTVMALVVTPGLDLLVSAGLLFWLDWRLACVAMLIWPLAFAGPRFVMPRALRATSRKLELESRTLQWVQENLSGQTVVKAFNLADRMTGILHDRNAALRNGIFQLNRTSGLVEKTSVIGIWTLQVIVLMVGGWMTCRGSLTIGALGAIQALFMTLANSLYYISQYTPAFIQAGGALRHIDALLTETPEVVDMPAAKALSPFKTKIEVDDVTFSYSGAALNLDRVSLTIPRGSAVAFVGGSGSGKSSMASLLMRLHDPSLGSVNVDGRDLAEGSQASWRAQIGLVSQDNFLFNLSVRENILHGKPNATEEEMIAAAKAAQIHEAIVQMPEGYDTIAGERGCKLSGGQRQRVAIARALIANPALLILDEATSALDPVTEAEVNRTLASVGRNRTVVSVTHRLASVSGFDQICVFDKGRVVEQGSHDHLISLRGAYYALWCEQTGALATVKPRTAKERTRRTARVSKSRNTSGRRSFLMPVFNPAIERNNTSMAA